MIERLTLAERDLAAAAGVDAFVWVPDSVERVDVEFAADAPAPGGAPS